MRSLSATIGSDRASSWKAPTAMMRTSFVIPASAAVVVLFLVGCAKEKDPAPPVDNNYPAPLVGTGTYLGIYSYSRTFNWAGNYSYFDTTFQATVRVFGEESRPEERRLMFVDVPEGYRPSQSDLVMIWDEAAQCYRYSTSSMRFHGPSQDNLNFTADQPGTTTQRTFGFNGVRQQ
jgi:hypothetical protein